MEEIKNKKEEAKKFEEGKEIVRVDNFGLLLNKIDKTNEILEKLQKLLYFVEKRQQTIAELEHPEIK
jgi:hypothetical protein